MSMRIGLIGMGMMGSIHHRIFKGFRQIQKIFLVDTDPEKLASYGETHYKNYHSLLGKVDAVSIASPTPTHFEIAQFFLRNKIPVLIEKPIASTIFQADKLLSLSKKNNTLIFIGHVERYNNAYIAAQKIVRKPKFIECHRLSPYPFRSLEVSVVLDLMIHDLDIILDIVNDKVKRIESTGVGVLSSTIDIANVRITFANGCIANVTASRISKEKVRKFRVFFHNHYISLDYANQKVEIYKKDNGAISSQTLAIEKEQPLQRELEEFIRLAQQKRFSSRSAVAARNALSLALKIQKQITNK